jgi:nitroreductase
MASLTAPLRRGVRLYRRLMEKLASRAARVAVRSGRLSSLYYVLFSRDFDREHRAVLFGKLRYLGQVSGTDGSGYLLRRNTHRLEKGLLMRPRRSVFARDYIELTVEAYETVLRQREGDGGGLESLAWPRDVLATYFAACGPDETVDRARARFARANAAADGGDEGAKVPYLRALHEEPSVSYDALARLAWRRRSVRWYLPRPVPRELIDQSIAVASLAPSACNRQPYEFRVFDDPARVREITALPGGTRGFAENIPVICVAVGKLHAYFRERDRHLIYVDVGLASMALMLALETVGLSSCPLNWPDIDKQEREMARVLGLAPDERPVMLIAIGYPDPEGMVAYSQKKHLDDLRSYNG